jgi:hypothetical protein
VIILCQENGQENCRATAAKKAASTAACILLCMGGIR